MPTDQLFTEVELSQLLKLFSKNPSSFYFEWKREVITKVIVYSELLNSKEKESINELQKKYGNDLIEVKVKIDNN